MIGLTHIVCALCLFAIVGAGTTGVSCAGKGASGSGAVVAGVSCAGKGASDSGGLSARELGGEDTLRVMFWNVENFFEPGGFEGHSWSKRRFYSKCEAVAKTILFAGDVFGKAPDVVGFAELGSRNVLKALLYSTVLRKMDYSIVHFDSPDRRGIDCGLIYRRSSLSLVSSKPCHIYDSLGQIMPTRDILLAVFDWNVGESFGDDRELRGGKDGERGGLIGDDGENGGYRGAGMRRIAILVNHHPSKIGKGSDSRRGVAMNRLYFIRDSLMAEGVRQIIAVGDFNEELGLPPDGLVRGSKKGAETLVQGAGVGVGYDVEGTIKFQGKWEQIDGCVVMEGLSGVEFILALETLSTRDSYGGVKPRRTFSGPRYLGGISDHYPVFYYFSSRAPSDTTTS